MRSDVMLLCLPLILSLSACGNGGGEPFLRLQASTTSSFIRNDPSGKWPNPRAVPVCIVNRSEISDDLYADVMNNTKREYARRAGIGLVGWKECRHEQFSEEIIRIYFARVHDWSPPTGAGGGSNVSVGKSAANCGLECNGGTMRIQIGESGDYPDGWPWWVVGSTRRAVIHEMGHALGLMHEHERNDAVNCAHSTVTYAAGGNDIYVDGYDAESIMNYCKSPYQWNLTDSDVRGLETLYPVTTMLENSVSIHSEASGKCIDINNFSFDPGLALQQYECNGGQRNQLFRLRNMGQGEFEIRSSSTDLCMDVWQSTLTNGAAVVQWTCNQTATQRVRLIERDNGRMSFQFVHSGRCLDVPSGQDDNNLKLQQWDCLGNSAQSFFLKTH